MLPLVYKKKINENITRHENKSIFLYGLYLVADN